MCKGTQEIIHKTLNIIVGLVAAGGLVMLLMFIGGAFAYDVEPYITSEQDLNGYNHKLRINRAFGSDRTVCQSDDFRQVWDVYQALVYDLPLVVEEGEG